MYWIFGLIVVLALGTAGCGSTTTETVTVTQTVMTPAANNISTQAETPASIAPPAPVSFKGTGATATPKFSLNEGLYRVTLQHDGQRNFIVQLLDSKGKQVDGLANRIGVVSETKAFRIDKTGDYLLNIEADGNWTINLLAE